jgi:hypothetical protein
LTVTIMIVRLPRGAPNPDARSVTLEKDHRPFDAASHADLRPDLAAGSSVRRRWRRCRWYGAQTPKEGPWADWRCVTERNDNAGPPSRLYEGRVVFALGASHSLSAFRTERNVRSWRESAAAPGAQSRPVRTALGGKRSCGKALWRAGMPLVVK